MTIFSSVCDRLNIYKDKFRSNQFSFTLLSYCPTHKPKRLEVFLGIRTVEIERSSRPPGVPRPCPQAEPIRPQAPTPPASLPVRSHDLPSPELCPLITAWQKCYKTPLSASIFPPFFFSFFLHLGARAIRMSVRRDPRLCLC